MSQRRVASRRSPWGGKLFLPRSTGALEIRKRLEVVERLAYAAPDGAGADDRVEGLLDDVRGAEVDLALAHCAGSAVGRREPEPPLDVLGFGGTEGIAVQDTGFGGWHSTISE